MAKRKHMIHKTCGGASNLERHHWLPIAEYADMLTPLDFGRSGLPIEHFRNK